MRTKTAFLIAPLLGLALTAQQPAPAALAPPPVPSCTELATALVNLGRNDAGCATGKTSAAIANRTARWPRRQRPSPG